MNMRVLFGKSDDFWIWSSSISASASNLQAILYIVVVMRFLAPFQYGASSSCSIFHINLEPSHTRQSNDFLWYGDSTHPNRDAVVAFASLIWYHYVNLRDRDRLVSGGRSYSAYWYVARNKVDDVIALRPWATTYEYNSYEARGV